ncbi:MAG: GBS Bsp-like repeat-containing protein [Veillonella parvula]
MHWYDADRQADGSYRAVVSISNHQYRMGTYRAHVYVTCGNGVEYNTNAGRQRGCGSAHEHRDRR